MIGRAVQSVRLRAADAADAVRGRRDPLTPPRRLTGYVGDSDFQTTGEEFLHHFRELAQLRPSDRVLDVGCGIGRMARVLAAVLRPPGSYDGFDVVRAGIDWCNDHYRFTSAPFRFRHADLRNASYNPEGSQQALTYRFPYDDGSFDLVIATSVFTHLLADTAEHYLAETARVLTPGGRLFSTWYLLDADHPSPPPPPFGWRDACLPAAIADPAEPEAAVAFTKQWLRDALAANGLDLRAVQPGSWAGESGASRQDLVVAYLA